MAGSFTVTFWLPFTTARFPHPGEPWPSTKDMPDSKANMVVGCRTAVKLEVFRGRRFATGVVEVRRRSAKIGSNKKDSGWLKESKATKRGKAPAVSATRR